MPTVGRGSSGRTRFDGGTAFELLASVAALADDRWRSVLTNRERLEGLARSHGAGWSRRATAIGRFGWINLMSLVAESPAPHSAEQALETLTSVDAETLHLTALGMRRRQLRTLVPDDRARAAVRGDAAARTALRRAAASEETVVSISRWLLQAPSARVRSTVLDLLADWQRTVQPEWEATGLAGALADEAETQAARLTEAPATDVIRDVSGGLVYAPGAAAGTTVLAPAASVDPAVIVVDDAEFDLIVYSPRSSRQPEPRERLLLMSRALGDDTRLRLLEVLLGGRHTATALAGRLGMPRTTLVHHLALLRSAGLITTEVLGNATYYALRHDAPHALGAALRGFYGTQSDHD